MDVTSPPCITALPDPPDPDDRSSFNTLAYPWSVAQQTFATEVAAVATNVYNNATDAATSATNASSSSTSAVAAANYKGAWSSLSGALAIPATVTHSEAIWLLTASVADVTSHTPRVSANWLLIQTGPQFFHLQDSKSSGTAPQSITGNSWNKRDLGTSVSNTLTGASVASSVITLAAGRYRIQAQASACMGSSFGYQRLRLRNTSDSSTILAGVNMATGINTVAPTLVLAGVFTLAASKTLELQHYMAVVGSANAGGALSSGEPEIYADVLIQAAPV